MSRVEIQLGCWWFVGCGIGKIARARGRVRAGSRDSPQENHDLRSDLAHCALHPRDGYHDHHRAPLTSRDSSEPDCSPTKTEPCCVFPFGRERFRQVSGLSAPRPLNERFVRRGRLLEAARERVLAFSSAPSARRRLSRAIPGSVISNPVWSDMLFGRFTIFCIQTSFAVRAVNSNSARSIVKESWRWRRDMAQGRTRPADAEVRPERDPRSSQRIPAPIPRAISPPTDTRPLLHFYF